MEMFSRGKAMQLGLTGVLLSRSSLYSRSNHDNHILLLSGCVPPKEEYVPVVIGSEETLWPGEEQSKHCLHLVHPLLILLNGSSWGEGHLTGLEWVGQGGGMLRQSQRPQKAVSDLSSDPTELWKAGLKTTAYATMDEGDVT